MNEENLKHARDNFKRLAVFYPRLKRNPMYVVGLAQLEEALGGPELETVLNQSFRERPAGVKIVLDRPDDQRELPLAPPMPSALFSCSAKGCDCVATHEARRVGRVVSGYDWIGTTYCEFHAPEGARKIPSRPAVMPSSTGA